VAGVEWIEPMLATLSDERDLGDEWVLERKLDGIRCLAFVRDGEVALRSRNQLPLSFPSVAEALAPLGDAVVDGEIVAVSEAGEPLGFQDLQRRGSAALWAFDLLRLHGEDLRARPLDERRSLLEQAARAAGPELQVSTRIDGPSRAAYERACAAGWEGLIAKRAGGPYRGGRSRDWLKLKCVLEQEVVVGGFTEPRGSRVGVGALLVGYHEDGALRYAGKVGTGFDTATLVAFRERLDAIEVGAPPFDEPIKPRPAGARWVRPEIVVQVGFAEWTNAGRLRQPRYIGLREDKRPEDVVRERPS
jgi:DNA ligase D-like protein (predicted ligase)